MFFYLTRPHCRVTGCLRDRPHTPLSLQQPRLLQGGEDPRVGGRGRTLAGFKKYKTQYSARVYFTQKYKTQYSARVYFTQKYKTQYSARVYFTGNYTRQYILQEITRDSTF
jgi:hypothetical protein